MLCWSHGERKWIEVKAVDLSRREVLSRNIIVSLPQDLGVKISSAIGVGRIAESYRTGESAVGKLALYEIDLEKPLCRLCPAHVTDLIELRSSWIRGPEIGLAYDLGIGENLLKRVSGSIMILGESLNSMAVALIAYRSGVSIYTLRRKIPGVRVHMLTQDSWDEAKVREFYIGGRLSDDEKSFLEEKLSHARKIKLFYHPLMKGSRFILSLGESITLRRISHPRVSSRSISLASRLYRLASEKYLVTVTPGTEIPENIYTIINFRREKEQKQ
ncbi:MAG: hypothetical protein QXJ51_01200 [Sulfolobales archaeon]